MPADLSKEAMIVYIKNSLIGFDDLRSPAMRAEKSNDLLTYIIVYFNHFITNFKTNMKLLVTIRERCVYFMTDEYACQFEYLVHTASILLDKINQAITEIQKNEKENCNCAACYQRKLNQIQHAESSGLVG